jgi:capsular polysaccharide biosynthesis protein
VHAQFHKDRVPERCDNYIRDWAHPVQQKKKRKDQILNHQIDRGLEGPGRTPEQPQPPSLPTARQSYPNQWRDSRLK